MRCPGALPERGFFSTTVWFLGLFVRAVKWTRCDLTVCSLQCRALVARANDDLVPLAQPMASPTLSLTTFILRRALIRREPCLALSHCRLCCCCCYYCYCYYYTLTPTLSSSTSLSLTNAGTSISLASDDSHNTSIVSRRIALFSPSLRVFIPSTASSRPTHIL